MEFPQLSFSKLLSVDDQLRNLWLARAYTEGGWYKEIFKKVIKFSFLREQIHGVVRTET